MAAGIQSPVPLEELEGHLREEFGAQTKLGLDEAAAFAVAVQRVGQARELRCEFTRATGWLSWLGPDRTTQIQRLLGLGWIGGSLFDLQQYTYALADLIYFPLFAGMNLAGARQGLMQGEMAMDLAGVVAGFYLFRGARPFRLIVWVLAGLQLLDTVYGLVEFPPASWRSVALNWYAAVFVLEIGFLLASLWWLRPQRKTTRLVPQ